MAESPTYVARTTLFNILEEIKEASNKYTSLPNLDPKYVSLYRSAVNRTVESTNNSVSGLDQMLARFELTPDTYIDWLGQMMSALTMLYDMIILSTQLHGITSVEGKIEEMLGFETNQPPAEKYKN